MNMPTIYASEDSDGDMLSIVGIDENHTFIVSINGSESYIQINDAKRLIKALKKDIKKAETEIKVGDRVIYSDDHNEELIVHNLDYGKYPIALLSVDGLIKTQFQSLQKLKESKFVKIKSNE